MKDSMDRQIEYVRISLTDQCNLRCQYCVPKNGVEPMDQSSLLKMEEIVRIVEAMAHNGVRNVKLTGGEPLLYKQLESLILRIKSIEGIEEVTMTTNGLLLENMVEKLVSMGLTAVNISLDTLEDEKYREFCRVQTSGHKNHVERVLLSIKKAMDSGMKTKVNCVPILGFNEDEVPAIAALARDEQVDVRFIELMPIGIGKQYKGISGSQIISMLEKSYGKARLVNEKRGNGPAVYYEFEGFIGKIGVISAVSSCFCDTCNRVRITANGQLKLCLNHKDGIDLKDLVRSGRSKEEMANMIGNAINRKPEKHHFELSDDQESDVTMVQIGG